MKKKLIQLLIKENAINFNGPFITKSQRVCPYFINIGNICTGLSLRKLASIYAKTINKKFGIKTNNIFGPAYKGTILSAITAIQLSARIKKPITFSSNRKEVKNHGEGGLLIGYQYKNNENVVIIDDVLTSASSIKISIEFLSQYNVNILGAVVCVDRQEYGTVPHISAKQQIEQTFNIPVFSILTITEIIDFIKNNKIFGKFHLTPDQNLKIQNYLQQYCIQSHHK